MSSMVSAKPATSGERLSTVWTYIGRKVVRPMIAMLAKKMAMLEAAIGRRNQRSGATIGASARRSCQRKRPRLATKTTMAMTV